MGFGGEKLGHKKQLEMRKLQIVKADSLTVGQFFGSWLIRYVYMLAGAKI